MSATAPLRSYAQANAAHARALVDALVQLGLRHVVISPGSRSAPLVFACSQHPEITTHTVLDERAAGFIALGVARMRGEASATVCTSGSAALHLGPAVVEAATSGVPLLLLTADRPRELHHCGAQQTIDQLTLYGAHLRASFALDAPERDPPSLDWLATVVAQAWLRAHDAPAGPVQINCPFREPLWPAPTEPPHATMPAEAPRGVSLLRGTRRLSPEVLADLAKQLASCARGVILCGPLELASIGGYGPELYDWTEAIAALAATLGWPLVAEPASQLRFCRQPLGSLIGSADATLAAPQAAGALAPELVLQLGATPTSKAVRQWLERYAKGRAILVDAAGRAFDPGHAAETVIAAEPLQLCEDLVAALADPSAERAHDPGWLARWREADLLVAPLLRAAAREALWEGALAREVVRALPDGAVLHVANSMPIRDLDTFGGTSDREVVVLCNRGASGIDGTIATAGGEALEIGSGGPIVALVGDLAFLHDLDGLAAVAQLGVELTVVVAANGGGGIFELLPVAEHSSVFEQHFLTPQRTRIADLCAAVGARWSRVSERGGIAGALAAAIDQSGLAVVEVAIDREDNVARHHRLHEAVVEALGSFAA